MESTTVTLSGNGLSEENWGLFQSKMSCSIINLLSSNYLQKGGHYRQRNCRREATIGILCRHAAGSARKRGRLNATSLHWSGDVQTLASAFGNWLSLAHFSHPLISGQELLKYRNSCYAFPVRLCWRLWVSVGWNALYQCWAALTVSYRMLA